MPNPLFKIKRGTTKPSSWNGTTGITAGEMCIDTTNLSFYIGNTFGQAITFGRPVVADSTLGGVSTTDSKIATQKSIKTYTDSVLGSLPGAGPTDIIFIRQITTGDSTVNFIISTDEESSVNLEGAGFGGLNGRWRSFYFNQQQENAEFNDPAVFKSLGSNSKFIDGGKLLGYGQGDAVGHSYGQSIKVYVSYQLSFDNFTNNGEFGYTISNDSVAGRRAAILIRTYSDGINYTDTYALASSGSIPGTNPRNLILNNSGIIDMPHFPADGNHSAGTGYIQLVWGTDGCVYSSYPSVDAYRYAGRSTNNNEWGYGLTANIAPGYAPRLIVAKLPI